MKYILAHDLGTSGTKAVLFTVDGDFFAEETVGYSPEYGPSGFVEQNPEDWWEAVCRASKNILLKTGLSKEDIACVSFSGQMNCCLPVDKNGRALRNAMIWADQRAAYESGRLTTTIGPEKIYKITGQRLGASYAVSKIIWFKDHQPELFKRTAQFLQVKDYVVFRLTGVFVTDFSDASHLGVLDLRKRRWSDEILYASGIDRTLLPTPVKSTAIVGTIRPGAASECGLLSGTPVVAGGGDGCCATVGAGVYTAGQTYNVLGTSSWIASLSEEPFFDPERKTFTFLHLDGEKYLNIGTMQSAGHAFQWALDQFCSAEKQVAEQTQQNIYDMVIQRLKEVPPGSQEIIFLPYLLGERSPWWNPDAKGCFIGLTAHHTRFDMLHAVLEGVAFNLKMILEAMEQHGPVRELKVTGGGARNPLWIRIFADVWRKPLHVLKYLEQGTSIGAVVCGGIGIGAFQDFSIAGKMNPVQTLMSPDDTARELYDRVYRKFQAIYRALEPIAFLPEEPI